MFDKICIGLNVDAIIRKVIKSLLYYTNIYYMKSIFHSGIYSWIKLFCNRLKMSFFILIDILAQISIKIENIVNFGCKKEF